MRVEEQGHRDNDAGAKGEGPTQCNMGTGVEHRGKGARATTQGQGKRARSLGGKGKEYSAKAIWTWA